ncbi:hypothetical protein LTR99_010399 [Exophiala xenobiotica]|uniref:Major facilitator superfamily (MFS) profile domain-containing protein n=1 Tax=Vermiconidia calcicola TaxID=1690605 RepID=A0AAV9Q2Z2_9PEZI|nr:hypothetical protein LTR72_007754 [Exophiala xenobiotica]KAK5530262.1 hypothetical protein LTR23_010420 [Chaetothyriales sp. CCFEE 6169]KAK5534117.1 hypothetical protein LTR25_007097 [Vermiconidia calcicola]KAK5226487.1 hypothetical protein LTR47_008944 [Exophiala xenobiotica]KAK5244212.1 hypothetical protein LTS06_010165 [Exophiala xenobiotica]
MHKDESVSQECAMSNETNPEIISVKGGFFHHYPSLIYCGLMCLGGFQLGLDLGSIAGMQAMPGFLQVFGFPDKTSPLGFGINPAVQQLINSLMSLGAFLSCLSAGPLGKYVSRKWSLLLAVVLNHLGVILMMAAENTGTLYAGRLIVGLANGLLDVIPQLYIHESAPAPQRGSLLGCFNVCVGVGLLVGSIVDNSTTKLISKDAYIIPLGLFFIVPTIMVVGLPFMPETPRWLVEHNKTDKARKSLARLRNKGTSPELVEAELSEIITAYETEKAMVQGVALVSLFKKTNLRRTLISFALLVSLGGAGSLFFLIFGTYFFAIAGQTHAFEESVGMTAAGLGATLISMWLITRIGRRTILLLGFAMQAICMLIIATVYQYKSTSSAGGKAMVTFVIVFTFFYNMCVAPYLYLSAGEIPTQRLRGYTLGIAIGIGFFFNWLCSYTAPYFLNPLELNWGGKYGYIWFGSNVVIFIFIFFCVPETKDRTLEEIDEMFEAKLPARKFKGYVCINANNARLNGMHHAQELEHKAAAGSATLHVESAV